jgi:hypothetical protein
LLVRWLFPPELFGLVAVLVVVLPDVEAAFYVGCMSILWSD